MIPAPMPAVAKRRLGRWLDALVRFFGSRQARLLVLGLFVAQAVILAVVMRPGVPPDETNHISFIQYYASHSLSPIFSHQKPNYYLGDKTREVDYLYHYLMSLVYRILPLSASAKYIAIRLFSVLIGLGTFVTLGAIARRLRIPEAVTTVGLLILTNLPMVLMLSSAINNDAPVWLGVALANLLLLRLWTKATWLDLLLLAEIVVVGGLVKRTMLPFDLLYGILGVIIFARHFRQFVKKPQHFDWRIVAVATVLLISSGLAVERMGGNMLRYHTPTPTCEQVQGVQPCSVFWGSIRAAHEASQTRPALLSFPAFVPYWTAESLYNIVDIQTQGWRHEVQPWLLLTPLLALLLIVGLGYGVIDGVKHWRSKDDRTPRLQLYVVLLGFYVLIVHMAYNFQDYHQSLVLGQALNGRYIIPGILPLGLLVSYYWTLLLRRHPQWVAILAIIAVVATITGSGLLMMVRNPQLFHG